MATWGYYNFDNDAAAEFSATFRDTHSLGLLSEALTATDLQRPENAQEALAAAEIVAALLGKPGRDLPADLLPLSVQLTPEERHTLTQLARTAVQAVAAQSGVQAHWTQSKEDSQSWSQLQQELLSRL